MYMCHTIEVHINREKNTWKIAEKLTINHVKRGINLIKFMKFAVTGSAPIHSVNVHTSASWYKIVHKIVHLHNQYLLSNVCKLTHFMNNDCISAFDMIIIYDYLFIYCGWKRFRSILTARKHLTNVSLLRALLCIMCGNNFIRNYQFRKMIIWTIFIYLYFSGHNADMAEGIYFC
jgi:hypothetical protein